MPWIESEKYRGREWWRPSFDGDWPRDVEHPAAPQAMRQPLPQPCPKCVGRLWRWVAGNRAEIEHRHQRAVIEWRREGSPGPEPRLEPVVEWVNYSLDHFRECVGAGRDLEAEGLGRHLRPRLTTGD